MQWQACFWKAGTSFVEIKNCPTSSEENVIKSLLEYISYEQTFCFFNLLSFYKLSMFSYVLALICLKGLFESRVAEAPVQHSQRSPSLGSSGLVPFRLQSFFAQVNQSLEQDSLTIRSAFRVQRPHSTTSLLPGRSPHLPKLLKDKNITVSIWSKPGLVLRMRRFVYGMWECSFLWSFTEVFGAIKMMPV